MQTATIVKITETQTTVRCPYCKKLHTHGNAYSPSAEGQTRMAHCSKGGEYKIIMEGNVFKSGKKHIVYFE